jgi:FkbM family methyltransferase
MIRIINKISVLAKIVFIFFKTGNVKTAFFFGTLKGGSNLNLIRGFSFKKNLLTHYKTGRVIHIANLPIFNNDISLLNEAFENYFLEETQGRVYVSIVKHGKKLTLQMNSFDSWGAFYEILVRDVYETIVNEDILVIDVGMNVGTAALFFASHDNVKKVYGFEPVPASCAIAEVNFRLNDIGSKIQFTCAALGRGEKKIQIPEAFSGSVGASVTGFVLEKIHRLPDYKTTIEVLVKDASTVINEISQKHTEKILLKLDCEGAEYEIIEDLFERRILDKISFIIIEWHYNGKQVLMDRLKQADFLLFLPDLAAAIPVGLIYGMNRNSLAISK